MSLFSEKIAYDLEPEKLRYILDDAIKVKYDHKKVLDICKTLTVNEVIFRLLKLNQYRSDYLIKDLIALLSSHDITFELTYDVIRDMSHYAYYVTWLIKLYGITFIKNQYVFDNVIYKSSSYYPDEIVLNIIRNYGEAYLQKHIQNNRCLLTGLLYNTNPDMVNFVLSIVTLSTHNIELLARWCYTKKMSKSLQFILNPNYINFGVRIDNLMRNCEFNLYKVLKVICYTTPLRDVNNNVDILRCSYNNGFDITIDIPLFKRVLDYKLVRHVAINNPRAFFQVYGLNKEQDVRVLVWKNYFKQMFVHNHNFQVLSKMFERTNMGYSKINSKNDNDIYDRRENLTISKIWDDITRMEFYENLELERIRKRELENKEEDTEEEDTEEEDTEEEDTEEEYTEEEDTEEEYTEEDEYEEYYF